MASKLSYSGLSSITSFYLLLLVLFTSFRQADILPIRYLSECVYFIFHLKPKYIYFKKIALFYIQYIVTIYKNFDTRVSRSLFSIIVYDVYDLNYV